jgi:hypothetical protein
MVHSQTNRPTDRAIGVPPQVMTPDPMPSWWPIIQRHSRLLVAVVNLQTAQIEWTSDRFRELVGMADCPPTLGEAVLTRLSPTDQALVRERVRRHVLNALLTDQYQRSDLLAHRWLYEPLIVTVGQTQTDRPRYVEFTVSSDRIHLTRLDAAVRTALAQCWSEPPTPAAVMGQVHQPDAPCSKCCGS